MSNKKKNSPPKAEEAKDVSKAKSTEDSKAKSSGDSKSKDKAKKQAGMKRWLREMKSELAKVQWPSKKETTKHTITVLCCVGLVGAFIWVYDLVAVEVVNALLALAQVITG
ncbi:MAG: preprotein translocase subunit SecE [Eubacteriales bacterium]